MDMSLLLILLVALLVAYWGTIVYLAWFKPELLGKLRERPGAVTRFLSRISGKPYQEWKHSFALWTVRIVGPIATALVLALLVAMLVTIARR